MYNARLFTDKLPDKVIEPLKKFSGNDCYLVKRDVDRKSMLSKQNNCHINVKKYIDKFGGEMLNGWLLCRKEDWYDKMGLWVWHYHSVWIKPDGKLVDVTDNRNYKNLPLSTFIPDTIHKVDLENGIAYNTIVVFESQKIASLLQESSGESRQLLPGTVYWTTNQVKHFRGLDEHSGQYRHLNKEYPANLKLLEEMYGFTDKNGKLAPLNPDATLIPIDVFFDFSMGGG
jgi:hypothetical protein